MKTCFKCNIEKPLSAFYKHSQMADGHLNKCKECSKLDNIKNRLKNIEYYRTYDKERSKLPHRIEAMSKVVAKYESVYPERKKAMIKVNNAIRDGRLLKQSCAWCGDTKVHGHHHDYSRPLDVIWLCAKHHKAVHHGKIRIYG